MRIAVGAGHSPNDVIVSIVFVIVFVIVITGIFHVVLLVEIYYVTYVDRRGSVGSLITHFGKFL
jgi:hypothetical protein